MDAFEQNDFFAETRRVVQEAEGKGDPEGIIEGSTFNFVAAEDRKTLKCVHAYTTDIDFEITPPMLVRKDLNV